MPDCPKCIIIKEFLKENNISFEDLNVKDKGIAKEMIIKSKQKTVPVIEIDGEITSRLNNPKG